MAELPCGLWAAVCESRSRLECSTSSSSPSPSPWGPPRRKEPPPSNPRKKGVHREKARWEAGSNGVSACPRGGSISSRNPPSQRGHLISASVTGFTVCVHTWHQNRATRGSSISLAVSLLLPLLETKPRQEITKIRNSPSSSPPESHMSSEALLKIQFFLQI